MACGLKGINSPVTACGVTVDEFEAVLPSGLVMTDSKTIERLAERSYVRDWTRLGLVPQSSSNKGREPFRLTSVNSAYLMCRRYLALVLNVLIQWNTDNLKSLRPDPFCVINSFRLFSIFEWNLNYIISDCIKKYYMWFKKLSRILLNMTLVLEWNSHVSETLHNREWSKTNWVIYPRTNSFDLYVLFLNTCIWNFNIKLHVTFI